LAIFHAAAAAVREGRGNVIVIQGEAGIGKSRFLEQCIRVARGSSIEVLSARATRDSAGSAYGLWQQVLDAFARGRPGETGRAIDAPELAIASQHTGEAGAAGSTGDRFAVFDRITTALARVAAMHPLLLAFDDLQEADVASLQLLRFLAQRIGTTRILVVATCRESEVPASPTAAETLDRLRSEANCQRITLHRLSDDEAADCLGVLAGGQVTEAVRSDLLVRAEGNPFLLQECWRLHIAAGSSTVPESVAELFERRLARVSEACRAVLEGLAAWGRDVDAGLAGAALGADERDVATQLEEAYRARMILPARERANTFRFSHQLFRDHVYASIPAERRALLHRRAAEVLDALSDTQLEERLAERAWHCFQGADEEFAERAVDRMQELGCRELARLGFEDALNAFENCLSLIERWRPTWHGRRCQVLLTMANAYDKLGDETASKMTLDRVRTAARADALPQEAGSGSSSSVARTLACMEVGMRAPEDDTRHRTVERTDSLGRRTAEAAVAEARRHGDPAMLMSTLLDLCWRWHDVTTSRVPESEELLRLAHTFGNRDLVSEARFLHMECLLTDGDSAGVDREMALFGEEQAANPEPFWGWLYQILQAGRCHLHGRFAESEQHAFAAASMEAAAPERIRQDLLSAQLFAVRTSQGRSAEVIPLLEGLLSIFPRQNIARTALASALCEAERYDEARVHFDWLAADGCREVFSSPLTWFFTATGLARSCTRLGARHEAAVLYDRLMRFSNVRVVSGIPNCYGATAGYLGMLAAAAGKVTTALEHFETSHQINARLHAWPVRAHMQYEHARVLLARRGRSNQSRARSLLREARATAVDFDMSGVTAWIDAL
jgi:hypothetical protein